MKEYSKTNNTLGLEKREATCGPPIWFSKHGGLEGMKLPPMIHTRLNCEHFSQNQILILVSMKLMELKGSGAAKSSP